MLVDAVATRGLSSSRPYDWPVHEVPRCRQDNPPEVSTSGGDESGVSARRAGNAERSRQQDHSAERTIVDQMTQGFVRRVQLVRPRDDRLDLSGAQ